MGHQQIAGIQSVLSRIRTIESQFKPQAPTPMATGQPSFNQVLQQTMANQYGTGTPDSLMGLMQNQEPGANWATAIAAREPDKIVSYQGFEMKAKTADKYLKLEEMIKREFPGRGIYVTSTMGGRHSSPAHPEGRAVDFVVDNMTRDESVKVEEMAKKCGFWVYNEYIHDSTYKTGDHMHIELD